MKLIQKSKPNRKPSYRQRSMRFALEIVFILLFLMPVAGNYLADGLFVTAPTDRSITMGSGALLLLILVIVESILYPKRISPLIKLLLLLLKTTAIAAILWGDQTHTSIPISSLFFYAMYFYFGIIPTLFFFMGGLTILELYPSALELLSFTPMNGIYIFFLALFAILIKRDERNSKLNTELYRELEIFAGNTSSLAKQEERGRISRELHDTLGHYLTAVNLQIQKADAYQEIDAEQSSEAMKQAQQATAEAIKELRKTVKNLREFDDSFNFQEEIQALVDGVQENGLPVEFTLKGNQTGYSELVLMTIHRTIQEGLTNIEKHASANQVTVNIDFGWGNAKLTIIDDGVGFSKDDVDETQSFGLKGIRERIDLLGGNLEIRSKKDQGTKLLLTLPKKGYA